MDIIKDPKFINWICEVFSTEDAKSLNDKDCLFKTFCGSYGLVNFLHGLYLNGFSPNEAFNILMSSKKSFIVNKHNVDFLMPFLLDLKFLSFKINFEIGMVFLLFSFMSLYFFDGVGFDWSKLLVFFVVLCGAVIDIYCCWNKIYNKFSKLCDVTKVVP